jgi:hypothetical protein
MIGLAVHRYAALGVGGSGKTKTFDWYQDYSTVSPGVQLGRLWIIL